MNKNYFPSITPIKTLKNCCFLLVISFSISSYCQDVKSHLGTSLPGSGKLEIPAGVGMSGNSIKVQTWGAGGGGGGCAALLGIVTLLNVGGGGGGGAFNEGMLNNVGEDPDNVKIDYTIGAGGAGGTSTFVDGRNGIKSFFSTVEANGGKGGSAAMLLGSTTLNGVGGQGGEGGSFSGGNGFDAGNLLLGVGLQSGAGGGGAGSGGGGSGRTLLNAFSQVGGAGGIANNNDGGAGGKGGNGFSSVTLFNHNGEPGGFPAGGGGGSVTLLDALGLLGRATGGNGGNGQIKVTYTCPVYTVTNITAANVCASLGTTEVTLSGFLPIGKYTITYDVSSPSQAGRQAVNIKATTAGTLKFTVTGLTTVGPSRITIKNITSVDCSTPISGKFVDVTVSPNLVASVSIAASPSGAICYGTAVTFTATPTNGGPAPVYQWKVNGVNVAGANSITYTSSTLKNADIVTCVLTSNATPCLTGNPATSNPIAMTVSGPAANPVTICFRGSGSLTASGCDESPVSITKNPGSLDLEGSGLNWYASNQSVASSVNGGLGGGSFPTKNLRASGFNINNIPANATITGIQVSIRKYSTHNESNRYVRDNTVSLIGGFDNKATVITNWSTTSTTTQYGGPADLWGRTWTPADINNVNFGVIIAANINTTALFQVIAYIENINITVTYYIPNPVNWYTGPTGGTPIFSGPSFNPVGVPGSGLADTNTAGVYTYYAACSTNSTCRTPVNFIINGEPTIAAISSPAALCTGGILNPAVPQITANSSGITASGWQLETGVASDSYANLPVPYTVALADNGKRIRYYVSNSCPIVYSNAVPITVNSVPAPLVGTPSNPICTVPTASVTISNLSGTWTINATPNVGLTGLTGTGPIATISGLSPGTTYNFTVSNGSCTSAVFPVVVKKLPVKTWNGTAWSPDPTIAPTIDEKVIFESDYNISKSVTACSCEVKAGVAVTFNSGYYLKLRNELIVDPDAFLTFENNASLVQMNDDAKNVGIISYKRETEITRYDYTYWSSPVKNWTLNDLSKFTLFDRYFSYDPILGWQVSTSGAATMDAGDGYIVRGPQNFSITAPTTFTGTFTGLPNNGVIDGQINAENMLLVTGKSSLLGNPYPSAISADKFLAYNAGLLVGTLYFWTHHSEPVATSGGGTTSYKYEASDYASYNGTGGVNTKAALSVGGDLPTGKIAAGQGFFAPAKADGKATFNNSMRLSANVDNEEEVIDNTQFYKLSSSSKTTVVNATEKSRIWLNLTNTEGAFKQTLIGYITGATNDYEGRFDGVSFNGNTFVDFYSINESSNLTIQGRALPFEQKDSVSLGYRSTIKGEFQISIDQKDGKLANQQVFLEDQLTQVLHDLKTPYSFETEIGTFNDRFVLRYEDKNAIIEDIDDLQLTAVSIATKDKKIDIKTTESAIDKVYIYDFSGNLVYSDAEINATTTVISNLLVDHSALIVHVVLENGKKTVKKIMY